MVGCGVAATSPVAGVAAELAPVPPQERVALYDVLRGFCLFGVLWSNLNDWYVVAQASSPMDHALWWTQNWLLEERFYSMLGFLFGIGFAIQLTRAEQRGQDVRNLFLRRMAVLLGFGLLHATVIWSGDILTEYALVGFALVPFRRFSPRKLLMAALALWLVLPYVLNHVSAILNLPAYGDDWRQLTASGLQVEAHGTWAQSIVMGNRQFFDWLVLTLLHGGACSFLALFILGLCALRVDLIGRLTRRRAHIVWALLGALACWAGLQYAQSRIGQPWPPAWASPAGSWRGLAFWWPPHGIVLKFLDNSTTWANSAVYALLLALAMSFPAAARQLKPLAALGRMTLTTYLTQSVVCTALFYHWGFGLMNRTDMSGVLAFTAALFSLQIVFSVWWLNRYRFGPAEWLWRRLSYGRKLPIRIAPKPPAAAVAGAGACAEGL